MNGAKYGAAKPANAHYLRHFALIEYVERIIRHLIRKKQQANLTNDLREAFKDLHDEAAESRNGHHERRHKHNELKDEDNKRKDGHHEGKNGHFERHG